MSICRSLSASPFAPVYAHPYYFFCHAVSRHLGERISLVTRGNDATFSSFVNAVVTATINAVKGDITRDNSNQMPLIYLLGNIMRFMFRDVVRYTGNYNDIYLESHDVDDEDDVDRGFNSMMTVEGMRLMYWGPDFT